MYAARRRRQGSTVPYRTGTRVPLQVDTNEPYGASCGRLNVDAVVVLTLESRRAMMSKSIALGLVGAGAVLLAILLTGCSDEPSPTPSDRAVPTPTVTAQPGVTPTPTPTMAPTHTPTATPIPTAAPTPTMAPTHTPTATPIPTAAPTPTMAPTHTPTATPTPTPTPTPAGPTIIPLGLVPPVPGSCGDGTYDTPVPVTGLLGGNNSPSWRSDCAEIAYVKELGVSVMKRDGEHLRDLYRYEPGSIVAASAASWTAWSPDGTSTVSI